MENIVKYYGGIDAELRRRRWLVTATLVFAAVVSVGTAVASFLFVRQSRDTVYVVDKGSTIMATIAAGDIQRDLEVEDHVRRFHELLFNLAPSTESQRRNLEQALGAFEASKKKLLPGGKSISTTANQILALGISNLKSVKNKKGVDTIIPKDYLDLDPTAPDSDSPTLPINTPQE
jgi:hypothetical protein